MPNLTHLTFPELRLSVRDAHKLRGYFGRVFEEHSPLLHNHLEGGELRYAYPLVQYKVLDGVPTLLGINEGAELLVELFLKLRELRIDGEVYPLHHKQIECREVPAGYSEELHRYEFKTLWFGLNQRNHQSYLRADAAARRSELNRILRGHILSAFKGMGVWLEPEQRIFCDLSAQQKQTNFKQQSMLGFSGVFTANALLPYAIGLGKSVSRGFGAVVPQGSEGNVH